MDEIIDEISLQLTGNIRIDLEYLCDLRSEHNKEGVSDRIALACNQMIDEFCFASERSDVCRACKNGEYWRVKDILEAILPEVQAIEASGAYEKDKENEYYNFEFPIERDLYCELYNPIRSIRNATFPFSKIYEEYGNALYIMGYYAEAKEQVEKAMKWAPCSAKLQILYARICGAIGEWDESYRMIMNSFSMAWHTEVMGMCYRNLAAFFEAQNQLSAAISCCMLCWEFDPDYRPVYRNAFARLMLRDDIPYPEWDEVIQLCETYNIPQEAGEIVQNLAFQYGERHFVKKEYDHALSFWGCCEKLVPKQYLEEIEEFIKAIKSRHKT